MGESSISRAPRRAYNRAVSLMPEHRETLDRIAQALRLHETLDAQQLRAIMEEAGVPVSALA